MVERIVGGRRRFVAMSLVAAGMGMAGDMSAAELVAGDNAGAGPDPRPTYLVIFRPGPNWLPGKPNSAQSLGAHGRYMIELYKKATMRYAGAFGDGIGGAMVFAAQDDAQAQALVAADPAVSAGIFVFELRRWIQRDWAQIIEKQAAASAPGS